MKEIAGIILGKFIVMQKRLSFWGFFGSIQYFWMKFKAINQYNLKWDLNSCWKITLTLKLHKEKNNLVLKFKPFWTSKLKKWF